MLLTFNHNYNLYTFNENSSFSTYSSDFSGISPKESEKKTDSFFGRMMENLLTLKFSFDYSIMGLGVRVLHLQSKLFHHDKLLLETHNGGKYQDIPKFVQYACQPFEVNDEIKSQVRETKFYLPSKDKLTVSPGFWGTGWCEGATTRFLSEILTDKNVERVVELFRGGIPFEGILHQEIMEATQNYISNPLILMFQPQNCKFSMEDLEEHLPGACKKSGIDYSDRQMRLILEVFRFLKEKASNSKETVNQTHNYLPYVKEPDFIDTVADRYEKKYGEPIAEEDREALEAIAHWDRKNEAYERSSYCLEGLEIEEYMVDSGTADDVIALLDVLEEGGYKINFPVYNRFGNLLGHHTVGFYLREDRTAIFYDSNYAIVETKDLLHTVVDLFVSCAGFSPHPLTNKERLKNAVTGRSSHPRNNPRPSHFELIKVRKGESQHPLFSV